MVYTESMKVTPEQTKANREKCRRYYWRNVEKQRARVLANYHEWVKDPNMKEHLRQINRKAKSVQRFGVESRDEILKRFKNKCANCDKKKKLVIHHLDNRGRKVIGKEKPNNSPENLIAICQGCHVLHHTKGLELQVKV